HLPRPLGRPDHRAEPAAEIPQARPTGRSLAGGRGAPRPRPRRQGPRLPGLEVGRGHRRDPRTGPGGRLLPRRGRRRRQRQQPPERPPGAGRDREAGRGPGVTDLVFADTQFAESIWIMIAKSIVIFAVIFGILPVLTVVERKLIGRFQHRYGPNRVGPFGLLQPLADVGKLISKESFRPENAISTLFILGPLLPVLSGVLALAII